MSTVGDPARERRRAGAFLLVGLGLALGLGALAAGLEALTERDRYTVVFQGTVAGLRPGAEVQCHGVPVGTIEAIHFRGGFPKTVAVEVALEPEVPINEGTRAHLVPKGITGSYTLELHGGTAEDERLEPGSVIPAAPAPSFTRIATDIGDLVERVDRFLAQHEEGLGATLAETRGLVTDGRGALAAVGSAARGIDASVGEAAASLTATSTALRDLIEDPALQGLPARADGVLTRADRTLAEADVAALVSDSRAAVRDLRRLEATLQASAEDLRVVTEAGRDELPGALRDLRRAARDVEAAAGALRRDPSRLVTGGAPPVEKPIPDPLPPLDRREASR